MTRDGTVGRSDATERSLALRWDVDPVRVMRPRFADSIRASSRFELHQQAGHMTASDRNAALTLLGGAAASCISFPLLGRAQSAVPPNLAIDQTTSGFEHGAFGEAAACYPAKIEF
jgi:hypothetical protein